MNILLWYLPFAMFSGACDVVIGESDPQKESKPSAEAAERAFSFRRADGHAHRQALR